VSERPKVIASKAIVG